MSKQSEAASLRMRAWSYICETAEGQSNNVNRQIAEALGWKFCDHTWYSPKELELAARKKKSIHSVARGADFLPNITGSLDDAVKLSIEFGFIATLGDIVADGLPGCVLCTSTNPIIHQTGMSLAGKDPVGRLARAVTSASLLAKAALLEAAGE